MRIDTVEKIWADLEAAFKNSKAKSRLAFLRGLVAFNGTEGTVKALQAQLKIDLDSSAETTYRYKAICNMLDCAEKWLLQNDSEIPDLNEWLARLEKGQQLDISRLSVTYSSKAAENLSDSIKLGFIFPGKYGKSERFTFASELKGFYFLNSVYDLRQIINKLLIKAQNPGALFEQQVTHIIQNRFSKNELEFPCVFIGSVMLNQTPNKFSKTQVYKLTDKILPNSTTMIDLDYTEGRIEISAGTKLQTFIIN